MPTFADAAHYLRELAAAGVGFGGTVVRFAGLLQRDRAPYRAAAAAGARPRAAGSHGRRGVADCRLDALRGLRALGRVSPGRLASCSPSCSAGW